MLFKWTELVDEMLMEKHLSFNFSYKLMLLY